MSIMRLITWIKRNKLASVLIVIVAYFILNSWFGMSLLGYHVRSTVPTIENGGISNPLGSFGSSPLSLELPNKIRLPPIIDDDYAPQPGVQDRLVIEESNLSLLVKNVVEVRNQIVDFAQKSGGYMVSSRVSNPQDAPTAQIVVRVPSVRLEEALEFFHSLAIKVVSENLSGQDVTDQYVDVEARIALLEKTKNRFESILDQATAINDITNLNQQIINTQNQIDSLLGQQDALSKNAQLAKLTIYLSTDEIALPYAPSETFRPDVIFKLAVRSLVGNLRKIAAIIILVVVYAVVWLPILFLIKYFQKKYRQASLKPQD